MTHRLLACRALALVTALTIAPALDSRAAEAGQSPGPISGPDIPITHADRVYAAEQFSNTISVIDPVDNRTLGVIRLGSTSPTNTSPLYRHQILVHGMGFSPDHHTLVVVSISTNSVTFVDTTTNTISHTTYVGRAPHEAFFTPDGKEVWVTIRGENYVSILDAKTYAEVGRVVVADGPGMQIFSPDGRYAYVCSSFTPELDVIAVRERKIVARVPQESPFCPNIAATPDGAQVWFTLKDTGRVEILNARPPFNILKSIETGPITNHVNFASLAGGTFAYVTVGGLDEVRVYRTTDFERVATVPVGDLPHGVWPSGDGSRMYVGLENSDAFSVIDTTTNAVIAQIPIGQAAQAVAYVPNAIVAGDGAKNLEPLGIAGQSVHFAMRDVGRPATDHRAPTSVALFDQGGLQVLQAAVTGLSPERPYALALSRNADGRGRLDVIATFSTNPAGAAVVDSVGSFRSLAGATRDARRYLVIVPGAAPPFGSPLQLQTP